MVVKAGLMSWHISITGEIIDLRRGINNRIQRFVIQISINNTWFFIRSFQPVNLICYFTENMLIIEAVAGILEQVIFSSGQLHCLIHRIVDTVIFPDLHAYTLITAQLLKPLDRAVRRAAVLHDHLKIGTALFQDAVYSLIQPLSRI